ncbi:MAG TPA: glycosyltransferase family 39 protein [Oligoflexia bacterium]|mgnify:CR=1 FL=1|nr:glycosyltransferase family 39 protein [Oligoflexia bacterium]HMP48446.1 glycosyltransferase family 39 protein [Oligoflexia bacterium]
MNKVDNNSKVSEFLLKLTGIFFLISPFIPIEKLFGDLRGIKGSYDYSTWLLSLSIFIPLAWFLSLLIERRRDKIEKLILKCEKLIENKITIITLFFILILILLFINNKVFVNRPLLIDSVAQLYQAEIFASGYLKAVPLGPPEFFMTQNILFENEGWYSQYPPGHSALLATGAIFSSAYIIPPLLSTLSVIFLFLFTKNVFGLRTAKMTLILFLTSPFFLFMGASFMNHVSALFFISGSLYFFERWENAAKNHYLLPLTALFATGAFLSRPLTALAFLIPFAFHGIIIAIKQKRLPELFTGAIFSLLAPGITMLYQKMTTGDFLLPAYIKLWGENHGLGFHRSPWGEEHTPFTGLRNELGDIRLLGEMLFEWPFPALFPLALFLLIRRNNSIWVNRLLLSAISVPAFYFFYWHRDAYLGPRFLYESIAALIPLTALSICSLLSLPDDKRFKVPGLFIPVRLGTLFGACLLISIIYLFSISLRERFLIYKTGMQSLKADIIKEANSEGIVKGLIFVKVSFGNRIFSELRGLGLSASSTQMAYSNLDHCLLYKELENANRNKLSGEDIEKRVNFLLKTEPKATPQTNDTYKDKTFKRDINRKLLPECIEELKYDESPYTVYFPHLRANKPNSSMSDNFIVAKDLRERNIELLRLYPDLEPYIYSGKGKFIKLIHNSHE